MAPSGSVPSPRIHTSPTRVGNGLFAFGGESANGPLGDRFSLDLGTMRWTCHMSPIASSLLDTHSIPPPRYGHAAEAIGGRLFVVGGCGVDGEVYDDFWVFNASMSISTGTVALWSKVVPKSACQPGPRFHHSMVAIGTRLFVVGGFDARKQPLDDCYVFDVTTATWQPITSEQLARNGPWLPRARHAAAAMVTAEGYAASMVLIGGIDAAGTRLKDVSLVDTDEAAPHHHVPPPTLIRDILTLVDNREMFSDLCLLLEDDNEGSGHVWRVYAHRCLLTARVGEHTPTGRLLRGQRGGNEVNISGPTGVRGAVGYEALKLLLRLLYGADDVAIPTGGPLRDAFLRLAERLELERIQRIGTVDAAAASLAGIDGSLVSLATDLRRLLNYGGDELADIRLAAATDSDRAGSRGIAGESHPMLCVNAHRAILAARSPFFLAMLCGGFVESQHTSTGPLDRPLTLSAVGGHHTLCALLEFLYTDDVAGGLTAEAVTELIPPAEALGFERLKRICEQYVIQHKAIDAESVIDWLVLADTHGADQLRAYCIDWAVRRAEDVSRTRGWLALVGNKHLSALASEIQRWWPRSLS